MAAARKKTLEQNFKKGDLLFGFNSLRASARFLEFNDENPVTIDKYIHEVIDNITINDDHQKKYNAISAEKYKSQLMVDAKSHNGVSNQYILAALTHWESKVPDKLKPSSAFPFSEKKLSQEDRLIRRACKAALLDTRITPHFILNGIDLKHTFDREYSAQFPTGSEHHTCWYDSFTSAEFHFILENWQAIENRIKFYLKTKENYVEINLFDWIAQQDTEGKEALLDWAEIRLDTNKLSQATFNKIANAVSQDQDSDDEFHQLAQAPKTIPMPAPPKPKFLEYLNPEEETEEAEPELPSAAAPNFAHR